MRWWPWPLSVTSPPPSITTWGLVFMTLAVARILIVTGRRPQRKRIIPPERTAARTADEVQLAAVPCPTTWSAWDVSTARPAAGTESDCTAGADRGGIERADGTAHAPRTMRETQAIIRRGTPRRRR